MNIKSLILESFKSLLESYKYKEPDKDSSYFMKAAEHIRGGADRIHSNNMNKWADDASMQKMFKSDHKDWHSIADSVEKGDIKTAHKNFIHMDTGSRDQIEHHISNSPLSIEHKRKILGWHQNQF